VNCTISDNTSATSGGGVQLGGAGDPDGASIISNCVVKDNRSFQGGGMDAPGGISPSDRHSVTHCTIVSNKAGAGRGGGLRAQGSVVENCIIRYNTGRQGGGVETRNFTTLLRNCDISYNVIDAGGTPNGAGVWILNADNSTVQNCTIVSNNAGNGVAGVYAENSVKGHVLNSIVYHNTTVGVVSNFGGQVGTWTNSCTTPDPGVGAGNTTTDPNLVDLAGGNVRLASEGSPCFNTGTNQAGQSTQTDLDGLARIVNSIVDMGAYEFVPPPPPSGTILRVR
jgi:hypothetical protein